MEGAQLAGLLWHLEKRLAASHWCMRQLFKAFRVVWERHTSSPAHVKVEVFFFVHIA